MGAWRWECGWLKIEVFPGMRRVVVRRLFKAAWFSNGACQPGDVWVGVRGWTGQVWPPQPRVHGGRLWHE